MKVIAVETSADLAALPGYAASPIASCSMPARQGRHPSRRAGRRVRLAVLEKLDLKLPFMVSGGLTADNVAEAVRVTRAGGVDVSSGVESAPGVKDPEMIRAFIRAARATEELMVR